MRGLVISPVICPYFALSFNTCFLKATLLLALCFMRCDSEVWLPRRPVWTGDVKLYIHAAAAGFRGGFKLASPLYSVPYRGTALFLLSWRESAEFEGVGFLCLCVCVCVLLYFIVSN